MSEYFEYETEDEYDGYGCGEPIADDSAKDDSTSQATATVDMPNQLSPQFAALFAAMERALRGLPEDLVAAIYNLPSVGTLPLPWTVFLFLSIIERRQRQKWGQDLIDECLPAARDIYELGEQFECLLTGHPEWRVEIFGGTQIASLNHRESKEIIYVDVCEDGNGAALLLQSWNALRRRDQEIDPASDRLLRLCPLPRGLDLSEYWGTVAYQNVDGDYSAVMELQENGLVLARMCGEDGPAPDDLQPDYFVVGESALQQEELVLEFLSFWKDPAMQLWCSALIGDWMRTHELAVVTGDEKLIRVAAHRAEQCRQDQVRRLIKSIGDGPAPFYALRGLYDLQAPELDEYVQRGLCGSSWAQQAVTTFLNFTRDPR